MRTSPRSADGFVLYVHNTSQVEGEPYPDLLRQKGLEGFPSMLFLSAEGEVLTRLDYLDLMQSGDKLVKLFADVTDALRARASLTAQRAVINRKLLITELRLGMLNLDEARKRVKAVIGGSEKEQQAMARLLVDIEVRALTSNIRKLGATIVYQKLTAMVSAGRLPSDRMASRFWFYVFRHAVKQRDAALYEKGIADLRRRFSGQPGFAKTLAHHEKQLATIRRKVKERP